MQAVVPPGASSRAVTEKRLGLPGSHDEAGGAVGLRRIGSTTGACQPDGPSNAQDFLTSTKHGLGTVRTRKSIGGRNGVGNSVDIHLSFPTKEMKEDFEADFRTFMKLWQTGGTESQGASSLAREGELRGVLGSAENVTLRLGEHDATFTVSGVSVKTRAHISQGDATAVQAFRRQTQFRMSDPTS